MTEHHLRRRLGAAVAATFVGGALLVPGSAQAQPAQVQPAQAQPGQTQVRSIQARPASAASDLAARSWWYDAMDVDQMHRTATGQGVTVAVIDGPFNALVPELKGKFTARSTCADAPAQSVGAVAAHGTTMAALIGGTGKGSVDGQGVRGIAPGARLLGYTIATSGGLRQGDLACGATRNTVSAAIDAAVKDGAKILSISIAASDTQTNAALGRAQRAGAIVVAATDDHDKKVGYPAGANGVLSVNAVDKKVQLAPFSAPWKFAGDISTVAPGVGVNFVAPGSGGWSSAGSSDGSSPAAAIVAGGLAVVWSHFPKATANQIIQLMVDTPGVRSGVGKDGKAGFFTSFRRSGTGLPHGDTKTGYGYGVFAPADMLQGDPMGLPDVNPFLDPADGFKPSYQEVTGKAPGATPTSSATTTASAGSGSSSSAPGQAQAPASSQRSGTSPWVWVGVGLLVLVLAGVGLGVARGRGATTTGREGN